MTGSGFFYVAVALGVAAVAVVAAGLVLRLKLLDPPFEFGAVDALVGISYGVLLGILVLFAAGHYPAAIDHSDQEATALNDMYKSAGVLEPAASATLRHEIVCYAREKIDDEWPALRRSNGSGSAIVYARTRQLNSTVERIVRTEPRNRLLATLFQSNLDRGAARTLMIEDSRSELPSLLWFVVLLGLGIVVFLLSLRYWQNTSHLVAVLAISVLLLVSMVGAVAELDRPFASLIGLQPRAMESVLTSVVPSSGESQAALRPCAVP
jgi:hypothetical protein